MAQWRFFPVGTCRDGRIAGWAPHRALELEHQTMHIIATHTVLKTIACLSQPPYQDEARSILAAWLGDPQLMLTPEQWELITQSLN
jgi:hypothetical protein